jgi:membrane protease subunit HflK
LRAWNKSHPGRTRGGRHIGGRFITPAAVFLLVAAAAPTSCYTVDSEAEGVVLRFGQYTATTEPGLLFKLPLGIDEVIAVPVRRQLRQEFGFRTLQAGIKTTYDPRSFDEESLMVTGDLNAQNRDSGDTQLDCVQ